MIGVQVTGMDQVMANLDQLLTRLETGADQAVSRAGETCKTIAEREVHVRTGATKRSIAHAHTKRPGLSESVVSAGTPYSPFLERRFPFIMPGFDQAASQLMADLNSLL
jgi:hypothetical protein